MNNKLTKGESNLLIKYNLIESELSGKPQVNAYNRFSGDVVVLSVGAFKLYDTIIKLNNLFDSGRKININEFDRLRYLFMKLFPKEYITLLD